MESNNSFVNCKSKADGRNETGLRASVSLTPCIVIMEVVLNVFQTLVYLRAFCNGSWTYIVSSSPSVRVGSSVLRPMKSCRYNAVPVK